MDAREYDFKAFYTQHIPSLKVGRGNQAKGLCPFHSDNNPSFGVNLKTGLWTCYAGCGKGNASQFAEKPKLPREPIPAHIPHQKSSGNAREEIAVYPYYDEHGKLLYEQVRYEPKTFRFRSPDGKGGYIRSLDGARRVLYRLPELLEASKRGDTLFIPEGEKDVENLREVGLVATCNPGGAGQWRDEFSNYCKGLDTVILADNDDAGRKHVQQVAFSLRGKALSIKILELPQLPANGDVSDWLTAGGNAADLLRIVQETPIWAPPKEAGDESEDKNNLPAIDAKNFDLHRVSDDTWAVLQSANNPPFLFRHGGVARRIEADDKDAPILRDLTQDRLRYTLARMVRWYRHGKGEQLSALPPMHVIRDILATPNMPLPILTRMVEVPVFASDGQLQTAPGYHAASRTYYAPTKGFILPEIPEHPSSRDIAKARSLILEELLGDFPFIGDAERAHAISLMLLPFARDLVEGATPLHLIEAPLEGTGKGLLSSVLLYPVTGRPVPSMTEGRDEDEWRKRITAALRNGPTTILIDNLRRRLESAALASAITASIWEDRLLGASEIVSLPVRCAWVATGNNPALSREMARRIVRIRMDAKQDSPWLRKDFRHKNLQGWTITHRADLVGAALTLIKTWLAEGRPHWQGTILGTFEDWSKVMGGILKTAGIPGFLGNLTDFYDTSDSEGIVWRAFVMAWQEKFGEKGVGVAQLWELNEQLEDPVDLGDGKEKSQKTKLGKILVNMRDRQYDGLRITLAGTTQGAKRWRLRPTQEQKSEHGEHRERFPVPVTHENSEENQNNANQGEAGKGSRCSPCSPPMESQNAKEPF